VPKTHTKNIPFSTLLFFFLFLFLTILIGWQIGAKLIEVNMVLVGGFAAL
jgi:hypothetical protein